MKLIVACLLFPLTVAQYGCTNCQTGYNTNSQYGNQAQRDPAPSGNEPGYLPDYQGDKYTDPQRIKDTQALNKPFFDSIGGAPSPPPLNPAQQGMTGPQYTNTGNNQYQAQYQNQGLQGQQYQPQQFNGQQNPQQMQYSTTSNVQYQPVNTMYSPQQQVNQQYQTQTTQGGQYQNQQNQQQYPNNQATQMPGSQPMRSPCNTCPQPSQNQQQYGRRRRSAALYNFMQK